MEPIQLHILERCYLIVGENKEMNENSLCNEVCNDFLPAFRMLAGTDVYSITLAGSHGKGIADKSSDFDFCLY